jgi:hypothetical protein
VQSNWYKIVDIENGVVKTLFHSVNGSRKLPINEWLTATKKMVQDGKGTEYLSGFHVMQSLDESKKYIKRFKNIENKGIVLVEVESTWKKEHSPSNVWLAEKVKIKGIVFQQNLNHE